MCAPFWNNSKMLNCNHKLAALVAFWEFGCDIFSVHNTPSGRWWPCRGTKFGTKQSIHVLLNLDCGHCSTGFLTSATYSWWRKCEKGLFLHVVRDVMGAWVLTGNIFSKCCLPLLIVHNIKKDALLRSLRAEQEPKQGTEKIRRSSFSKRGTFFVCACLFLDGYLELINVRLISNRCLRAIFN